MSLEPQPPIRMPPDAGDPADLLRRIANDWQDGHDEELELEFEDQ